MAEAVERTHRWFQEWGDPVGWLQDPEDGEFPVFCRRTDGALLIAGYAFGKDAVFLPVPPTPSQEEES